MDGMVIRERPSFHVADYVIFGLMVVASSAVGVYFATVGGRQKTTSEYLVGNRNMNVIPVALSLIVSFESSVLMLGVPAEVYAYGTQYWIGYLGLVFTFGWLSQVVVPMIHPLGITSTYQYLELRYKSRVVRRLASILGILYQVIYMGIVLFGPATALEAASGFPVSYSIVIIAVASAFYTSLGGIKAVVWTDTLQLMIMMGGIMAVIIMGCIHVGGFGRMWQLNANAGRVQFFDFNPDPLVRNSFWTLCVGSAINYIEIGFNQTTVQRVVSLKKLSHAKFIVFLIAPGFTVIGILACLEGMVSYAYFAFTECDPYGAKIISNSNQVLPYVVTALFRSLPGLPGLYFAALFSASLSTLSSSLSSISAMVWTDFLQARMKNASETKSTIAAQIVVVIFGAVSIGIAFVIQAIGGPLQQVYKSVLGSVSGPLCGMFITGCLVPFANSVGVLTGAVVSVALSFWMSLGANFSPYAMTTPYFPPAPTHNCYVNGTYNHTALATAATNTSSEFIYMPGLTAFYSISFHYRAALGLFCCVIISVIVSLFTGGRKTAKDVDPKYLVSPWDSLLFCFPQSFRRMLRYKSAERSKGDKHEAGTVPEEQPMFLKDMK